ncbi:uncharacterized protein LOC128960016 [Oppia nitens]|uniref:uncharacterized protein LOC128960016 n=1 Tax=Oppia nitens TaxID=1686743 RepID=UPI0023DBE8C2|nr:uncharacterized protein LOC128960016 [Oppia nitens]
MLFSHQLSINWFNLPVTTTTTTIIIIVYISSLMIPTPTYAYCHREWCDTDTVLRIPGTYCSTNGDCWHNSTNSVYVDSLCYCQPNYKYNRLNSWNGCQRYWCQQRPHRYSDCRPHHDYYRYCDRTFGQCRCERGYHESPSFDGMQCIEDGFDHDWRHRYDNDYDYPYNDNNYNSTGSVNGKWYAISGAIFIIAIVMAGIFVFVVVKHNS